MQPRDPKSITETNIKMSSSEIISACRKAVSNYDASCQGFLEKPSRKAINRKHDFLLLLSTLNNATPEEIVTKVYTFYNNEFSEDPFSRLGKEIKKVLFSVFNIIEKSIAFGNALKMARQISDEENRTLSLLGERMKKIAIDKIIIEKHEVRRAARKIAQGARCHESVFLNCPKR